MINRNNFFSTILVYAILSITIGAQSNSVSKVKTGAADQTTTSRDVKKKVTVENIEQDISEALTLIQDNHYSGDNLNYNGLFKNAIDTALHTLDPHSNYFDAKETEEFRTSQSSRYFGIGATINSLRDKDGKVIATFIKATFEGAPANRAGLRYGDKIVEVNGVSVLGKHYPFVRDRLRGPRGTLARVVIERYGTGKRETVEIIRDAVSTPSIQEAYMIRPGIGYVAMTGGFNRTTFSEFREAMKGFKSQGLRHLVIDLRGNGGGLVNQAYYVANTFLKTGQTVFTQKGRVRGSARSYRAENTNPDATPIVILVNGSTASASEILAGALQDHDRALIVGENTFGKGLVQNPFPLSYGSMLLLTIAKYETPSGRLIQKDYSNGNLYDYYTNGGSLEDGEKPKNPKGKEKLTDSGRVVYSGGGIAPDIVVKTPSVSNKRGRLQRKLLNPIFAFALDLAFGKVGGFKGFVVNRPIAFNRDLNANEFRINSKVFAAFKSFAAANYGFRASQVEQEKEFVERILRTELVTASYGSRTSFQVYNEYDPQLKRAMELRTEAQQLALKGARANNQSRK